MEKNKLHEAQLDPNSSPALEPAYKLIGKNKFDEATEWLQNFIKSNETDRSVVIDAYSQLIRIASEKRDCSKNSEYVDAVKKLDIETDAEKNRFAYFLYVTGTSWIYSGDKSRAKIFYSQSLQIAESLKDPLLIFKNKLALAEIDRNNGDYEEVVAKEAELIKAAEATGQETYKNYVTILMGNINRKQGNYEQAISCFNLAREKLSADRNSSTYHYVLWALGTSYAGIEDEEKAQIFLNLATSKSKKNVEFWRINVLSKMTLAELKVIVGKYKDAEKIYDELKVLIGGDEYSYYGRRVLRGVALLKIKEGQYDEANSIIDKLVIHAVKNKNDREIMRLRTLKAEVLLRTGEAFQHEQAVAMIEEALVFNVKHGMNRHVAVCLELLSRLDSRTGYFDEAFKKAAEMVELAKQSGFDRLYIRAKLIEFVLRRKLGQSIPGNELVELNPMINKLNAQAERVITARFQSESYDKWTLQLSVLDENNERYVNEFFEDFHFVPEQSIDMEIDPNSHYVREKHLGEIPFHNKFTLMKILLLLAETPGREFSKEELSQKIWDQEYNPLRHDNNIYININRLRKLVEPNPRESRYIMNGSRGYYYNPAMKVNFSTKISNTAPRLQASATKPAETRT